MLSEAQLGFFGGFLDFKADKTAPGDNEFARLARKRQWKEGSSTFKKYQLAYSRLEGPAHHLSSDNDDCTSPATPVDITPDSILAEVLQHVKNGAPMPTTEKRQANADITPDWILADTLEHLSLTPRGIPGTRVSNVATGVDDLDSDDDGVVVGYFDRYPEFDADASGPIQAEFARLAQKQGWKKRSAQWEVQRIKCYGQELITLLDMRESGLSPLQSLCRDIGADPIPPSNNQCNKYLNGHFINIFDYIDAKRADSPIPIFLSFKSFRRYTRGDKVFPKAVAKEFKVLDSLLERMCL